MTSFTDEDRAILLAVKGVGPGVLRRLEESGIGTMKALADASASKVCSDVALALGQTCWKNSPKARQAVEAAIARARLAVGA